VRFKLLLTHPRFQNRIYVLGEELTKEGYELPRDDRIYALVDIVDGTDLLEMGFPLWGSAVLLFQSPKRGKPKILGAVVALPTGEVYFASAESPHAFIYRKRSREDLFDHERVASPSDVSALRDARIAFYGQKAKNILSLLECPSLVQRMRELDGSAFRLYNFAGNPAMVKFAHRVRDEEGGALNAGIDAIFDVSSSGQKLHDVMPGAYIALKAGASLFDLDGNEITIDVLRQKLLKPTGRMKYVLAATESLAKELCATLGGSREAARINISVNPHAPLAP